MNKRLGFVTLLMLTAAGCERFDHVGRPPPLSPTGQVMAEPLPTTQERIALAEPRQQFRRQPQIQPERATPASLWRSGPTSLFGDRRAQGRGDILTVVIEIDEEAEIENTTTRSRSANEDLGVSALFGLPAVVQDALNFDPANSAEVSSNSGSTGAGSVSREEEITLRVAATVVDVLPNGHFIIAGNQEVRVNFELRDLRVHGVIRPEDISRRNEITYDKIADARISYGGRGQITDLQQPRIGQQIYDIIVPF
ncbi:MAG: flagellar basal body L-ring protein FlgH [Pseudomonadota bacterium]